MLRRASGLYEDEVDIHLNPKIGADWQLRGQQNRWSRGTGKTSYVGGNSKVRRCSSAC